MRITTSNDSLAVHSVYTEALHHANSVGHIDWPSPFPISLVDSLISTGELYCFEDLDQFNAAVRMSTNADLRIWQDTDTPALYLSKIATGNTVRGTKFFEKIILPKVAELTTTIRLDCLADNARLKQLYMSLGFVAQQNVTFYSLIQNRDITVTPFEYTPSA